MERLAALTLAATSLGVFTARVSGWVQLDNALEKVPDSLSRHTAEGALSEFRLYTDESTDADAALEAMSSYPADVLRAIAAHAREEKMTYRYTSAGADATVPPEVARSSTDGGTRQMLGSYYAGKFVVVGLGTARVPVLETPATDSSSARYRNAESWELSPAMRRHAVQHATIHELSHQVIDLAERDLPVPELLQLGVRHATDRPEFEQDCAALPARVHQTYDVYRPEGRCD